MGKFIGDGSGLTNLPSSIPSGGIIIWSGSTTNVPSGWALCDGQNGTPDLRSRFVVGAGGTYPTGSTGGSADAVVPQHSHSASTGSGGSHSHSGSTNSGGNHTHNLTIYAHRGTNATHRISGYGASGRTGSTSGPVAASGSHTHSFTTNTTGSHTHTVTVSSTGESVTGKNLPPYYAMAYIMKL